MEPRTEAAWRRAVLFSLFEKQLKLLYPHAPEITYDLRDMYQWLDQLVRSAMGINACPASLMLASST